MMMMMIMMRHNDDDDDDDFHFDWELTQSLLDIFITLLMQGE